MKIDFSQIIIHDGQDDDDFFDEIPKPNSIKFSKNFLKQESFLPTKREIGEALVITNDDANYPKTLKNQGELYCIGDISLLNEPSIAIIGSRKPSIYGINQAEKFAYELAKSGLVIVSGMARGIDSAAHKGALAADGKTIAVLGCGVDICYPPENDELKKVIEKNGLIISPFPLGTAPTPTRFPARNRIVSGISKGVLVVECSEKSGTFSTVAAAEKLGLPVWTIPTNLDNHSGKGNFILIQKGAKLAMCAKDISDELGIDALDLEVSGEKSKGFIMNFHPSQPIGIEELMKNSGLSVSDVNNKLLELELDGKIKSLANKTYVLA